MSRVDFYHLQKQSPEEVLPVLLNKAYAAGCKICLKTISEERVTYWNGYLWTYNDESFLPHGSKKDGFTEFYISTTHTGLYEKFGCEYLTQMLDFDNEPTRVYVRKIN